MNISSGKFTGYFQTKTISHFNAVITLGFTNPSWEKNPSHKNLQFHNCYYSFLTALYSIHVEVHAFDVSESVFAT